MPFILSEVERFQSLAQKNTMKDLITFGKFISIISFIIGTTLFSLYLYFNNSNDISSIGFYFVVTALILNSLLLTVFVVALIINSKHREELLKTCGMILLNIPIAIFYFYIVISIEFTA